MFECICHLLLLMPGVDWERGPEKHAPKPRVIPSTSCHQPAYTARLLNPHLESDISISYALSRGGLNFQSALMAPIRTTHTSISTIQLSRVILCASKCTPLCSCSKNGVCSGGRTSRGRLISSDFQASWNKFMSHAWPCMTCRHHCLCLFMLLSAYYLLIVANFQ